MKNHTGRKTTRSRICRFGLFSRASDIGTLNMLQSTWMLNADAIRDFNARQKLVLRDLKREYIRALRQLEEAKKHKVPEPKLPKEADHWMAGKSIDELNSKELKMLTVELLELNEKVNRDLAKRSSAIVPDGESLAGIGP